MAQLRKAAFDLFSRPSFYWALAAVFWIRVAVLTLLTARRLDTEGMWEGAHAYLTNPAHMYDAAADFLARTHVIAQPGGLDAFVSPPPVAVLPSRSPCCRKTSRCRCGPRWTRQL